jgi:pyruvate,water dikinase
MRCPGEIDLTQTRWSENPVSLFPAIVGHIDSTEPGEHRKKFRQGELDREEATQQILALIKQKPFGFIKGKIMARMLKVFTTTMALREHPKYMIIQCFWIYKKFILEEASQLVAKGVLNQKEDVYYLRLSELISFLEGTFKEDVQALITKRREEYENHRTLTPPRVMTSEGEVIKGINKAENLPEGALPGTPVSSGVVEGRAKVVVKPEEGKLEKGDILIAPFTDPGWTPLFISAKGLVMEVGGLMTHGAVVAREYGIPAVVGVENATKLIKDGQRVRVHGDLGYVEVIDD